MAQDLVRGWEASGEVGVVKPEVPTVAEAVAKIHAAVDARQDANLLIVARTDVMERHDTWSFTTRREIQRRLVTKGYYSGPAHGFIDGRTKKALDKLASRG